MARKRMVTRTISVTEIKAVCANLIDNTVADMYVSIIGPVANKEVALKKVKKLVDNDERAVIAIKEMKCTEALFKMSEEDFVEYATECTENEN